MLRNDRVKRVLGLVRVSTKKQDVAMQESVLAEICEEHVLLIENGDILRLHGVSGTATLTNTQMLELIEAMKRPEIEGLAVYSLDRILRPGKDFGLMQILDLFKSTLKPIFSLTDGLVDLSTDEGMDTAQMAAAAAGCEWRRIRRRTTRGRLRHLKAGGLDHGTPPYGYRYERDRNAFAILEEQACWVRRMFEWRRAGAGPYEIARRLNEAGVKSQRAGKVNLRTGEINDGRWGRNSVTQTLANPTYKGEHHRCGFVITGKAVPAIVSAELWDEVQVIAHEDRRIGRPTRNFLLTKLIRCARCKHRANCHSQGRGRFCYRCANRTTKPPIRRLCPASQVGARELENAVWSDVWGHLTNPKRLLESARALVASQAEPGDERTKLERKLRELTTRKTRVGDRYEMGELGPAEYRGKITELEAKIREIEQALRGLRAVITLPGEAQVESILAEFIDAPEPTGTDVRRGVLDRIRDFSVIYDDRTREYEISGAIPVPEAASGRLKCTSGVNANSTSTATIPFKVKGRLAA